MLKIFKSNSSFRSQFSDEKSRLTGILGSQCAIEHVGSTAIDGLDGKGIIDILIGFSNENQIEKAAKKLIDNGYFSARSKSSKKDYLFLASSEDDTTIGDFHLHLALKNSNNFTNFIKIRDYLQNNPEMAKKYSELKYSIAENTKNNRDEYKKQKSCFIENILKNIDK